MFKSKGMEKSGQKKFRKRSSVRFKPDEGTYALIDLNPERETFDPTLPALVFSEAHNGVGLIVVATPRLQNGDIIRVQVGNLAPLKGEVRWREQLDVDTLKIGLLFKE